MDTKHPLGPPSGCFFAEKPQKGMYFEWLILDSRALRAHDFSCNRRLGFRPVLTDWLMGTFR